MPWDINIPDTLYFQRRLGIAAAGQAVPASVSFDLARSPVDNSQLGTTVDQFGAPTQQNNWGISSFVTHLTSSQPDTIKTPDLSSLQDRLKQSGFLRSDHAANGTWDSESQAALDHWDANTASQMYSGNHMGATTTKDALAFLGWMLPSQVFQGLVGAAKGFVQQTPQTVERLGALGGAGAGAAIGGSIGLAFGGIGVVPGAIVGAGIGAAVGFLGDLFSKSEGEADQSALQNLWDSITPYQEYTGTGGFGKFMEDLGWVATASSLAAGVGGGVQAGIAGAKGIATDATANGVSFLAQGVARSAPSDVGYSSKIIAKVVGLASDTREAQALDFFKTRGLLAQAARPILSDVVTPTFTGLSSAQVGARMFSNLGAGANETTIHQAIREAPKPTGTLGTLIDLSAFVIQPTQFLPVKLGDLVKATNEVANSDASFGAWINIERAKDPTLSFEQAKTAAMGRMGSTPAEIVAKDAQTHLSHGMEIKAFDMAHESAGGLPEVASTQFFNKVEGFKDDIMGQVEAELGGNWNDLSSAYSREAKAAKTALAQPKNPTLLGKANPTIIPGTDTPMIRELAQLSHADTAGYEAYLGRTLGPNSTTDYFNAADITKGWTQGLREGHYIALDHTGGILNPGKNTLGSRTEIAAIDSQVAHLEQDIKELKTSVPVTADPQAMLAVQTQIKTGEAKLKDLKKQAVALRKTTNATWEDRVLTPARADTLTVQDYLSKAQEAGQLHTEMEVAQKEGNLVAASTAQEKYLAFLQENHNIIPPDMYERARGQDLTTILKRNELPDYLQREAAHAPVEVKISDPRVDPFPASDPAPHPLSEQLDATGYKAVMRHRGTTLEFYTDPRIQEVTGMNDFTRRGSFFQSIGLGVNPLTESGIQKLRAQSTKQLLDAWVADNPGRGWDINGEGIAKRLYNGLHEMNNTGVVTNDVARGISPEGKAASVVGGFIVAPTGTGAAKLRHFAVDARDLKPDDVYAALSDLPGFTRKDAAEVFGAVMQGGALGAEMHLREPIQAAHELGRVLRVSGLQGFTDIARTWHLQEPGTEMRGIKGLLTKEAGFHVAASTVVGASLGAYMGDDKVHDALRGAGIGLAAGLGIEKMSQRNYGYLPDYLHKVAMALRYSLSPYFDIRRFTKQNLLAGANGLPPMWGNGERKIKAMASKYPKGLYHDGAVSGEQAWDETKQLWNELNKVGYTPALDAFDRTMFAAGITGYNPQQRMMAHAYMLAQRGMPKAKISEVLKNVYAYGTGRSAMEKSINYVFFPFSFEKKLVSTLGSFILQNPGRSLLLYEGARRYYQSDFATNVQDYLHRKAPLLEELQAFNAFSHGISPGRFLYEGLGDHRTNAGKAAQILASFYVPGGASVTPLQEAIGGLGDLAASAFAPVVVTGQSLSHTGADLSVNQGDSLAGLAGRYIPFIHDLNGLWTAAQDQKVALLHGESKWSQLGDYYQRLDSFKQSLTAVASMYGYSSVDGLLQSDQGAPYKAQYDAVQQQARQDFPTGWSMAQQPGENLATIQAAATQDVLKSHDTSAAYDAIRQIYYAQQSLKSLGESLNMTQLYDTVAANQVRAIGLQHAGDPRFAELWKQLYEHQYGPIVQSVAT